MPSDSALRAKLMRIHHDDEFAGHFGRDKTETLLKRKYYWPELAKDVAEYVATCEICQKNKARRHRPWGSAQALPMPSRAWQEITMDLISDLPPGLLGKEVVDAILVIVDWLRGSCQRDALAAWCLKLDIPEHFCCWCFITSSLTSTRLRRPTAAHLLSKLVTNQEPSPRIAHATQWPTLRPP